MGERVNVIFNDELSTVDESELDIIQAQGGRIVSDEELPQEIINQEARDSRLQAGVESLLRGPSASLSDIALVKSGITTKEELDARQAAFPAQDIALQGLGIGGSIALTGGLGAAPLAAEQVGGRVATGIGGRLVGALSAPARGAIKAGRAVENAVASGLATRAPASIAKVAAKGAGLAAEGALQGTGEAVSEAILDPEFTPDAMMSHIGLSALLGGALGAGGTALAQGAKAALPAGVQALVKGARKIEKGLAGPISKVSGTDAAEIRRMAETKAFLDAAERKAQTVVMPHAKSVAKATEKLERAIDKLRSNPPDIVVTNTRRTAKSPTPEQTYSESVDLSRGVRSAAAELGDTQMAKAGTAYDKTIANLSPNDTAGAFQATLQLRNSLAKNPAAAKVIMTVDDHLANTQAFGKAAEEFASRRDTVSALMDTEQAVGQDVIDGMATTLAAVKKGDLGALDTLMARQGQVDKAIAASTSPVAKELRKASQELRRAATQAQKAVVPVNEEREAARGLLSMVSAKARGLAEELMPSDAVGRAVGQMLRKAGPLGPVGGVGAAALGIDPLSGLAGANAAQAALQPKQFLDRLAAIHGAAETIKRRNQEGLKAWLKGDRKAPVLNTLSKANPGLSQMLSAKSDEGKREGFKEYTNTIRAASENPEKTAAAIQAGVAPLKAAAPNLANTLANMSLARIGWLLDNMPQSNMLDPFSLSDPLASMSSADMERFARMAAVVENPQAIVPRVVEGSVTKDEVRALRETAPGFHAFLIQTLAEELPTSKVDYNKKLTLGTVFDIPTVAALTPQLLAVYQTPAQQQQPQGQINTGRTPTPASQAQASPLDTAVAR